MLRQFCPTLQAQRVTEITAAFLAARGIRALILDLDNTLVPWRGSEIPPPVAAWVKGMQAAGIQLCILSNTNRPRRLAEVAKRLGLRHVPSGGKPGRRGFRRALEAMAAAERETAVVGDQLLTDIWGGNRCGLVTILVEPLSPVEFVGTKVISRNVERLIVLLLRSRGVAAEKLSGEAGESTREVDSDEPNRN